MPSEPQDTTDPAAERDEVDHHGFIRRKIHGHQRATMPVAVSHLEDMCIEYDERGAALARFASAVGLPGAGVDEVEAAIQRMQVERDTAEQAFQGMTHVESMLRAEIVRLRAELAEAHSMFGELSGVAAAEVDRLRAELAEARDTGTDEALIARCVESAMTASGSFLGDPDLKRDEYWRNIVGAVLSEVDQVWDSGTDDRDGGAPMCTCGHSDGHHLYSTGGCRCRSSCGCEYFNDARGYAPAPASPVPPAPEPPSPPGVADVMRLHGIDPTTYRPPIVSSTNTALAAAVPEPNQHEVIVLDDDSDYDALSTRFGWKVTGGQDITGEYTYALAVPGRRDGLVEGDVIVVVREPRASIVPDEAAIERAARALFFHDAPSDQRWEAASEAKRHGYLTWASAVLAEAASSPAPDEARDEDDDDCDLIEAVHQLQDEQADRFNCDPPGTAAAARKRIAEFNARDPFGPEEERPADCGFCTIQGKWFHINHECPRHKDM